MLVRPDNLPSDLKDDHLMQRNYHISSNVYDIVVKFEEIKNILVRPYHLPSEQLDATKLSYIKQCL